MAALLSNRPSMLEAIKVAASYGCRQALFVMQVRQIERWRRRHVGPVGGGQVGVLLQHKRYGRHGPGEDHKAV